MTTMAARLVLLRPLVASSVLIASLWPTISRSLDIDPAVHDRCANVSDYVGCVKLNSRYLDSGASNRRSGSSLSPQSATNTISPRDPGAFGGGTATSQGRKRGRSGANGMMQSGDSVGPSPSARGNGSQDRETSATREDSTFSDSMRGGASSGGSAFSTRGRSFSRQSAESFKHQTQSVKPISGRSRGSRVGQDISADNEAPRKQPSPSASASSRLTRRDSTDNRPSPQQPAKRDRSLPGSDSPKPAPERVTRSGQAPKGSEKRSAGDSDSSSSSRREARNVAR